ncbi:MAG: 50S ribosomal protein L21 [Calditrichaeota bacterium]|jgi:large subunit ribosomal protein L21|nr:50S ribosomal protein L21 [Calditrichota bacterium]MBT7617406.1 50S ribosomal protein L21 [Calditrichota bacterium]MBT7790040.1 50S ribosomal protein L21 [Calditrichota bacterium]
MYAIVKIAGRQYRVSQDEAVEVDRIDVEPGGQVTVEDVMMIADGDNVEIGTPQLPYKVNLEVVKHDRRAKVRSVHFKRRGGMRRTIGHKQQYTVLKVKSIEKGS